MAATKIQNKPPKNAGLRPVPLKDDNDLMIWWDKQAKELLHEISASYRRYALAAYRRHESDIVGDISPQAALRAILRTLRAQWRVIIDRESDRISESFISRADRLVKKHYVTAAKAKDFLFPTNNTREINTVYQSLIEANARLITDLSTELISKTEGIIWRGVSNGSNLQFIRDELIEQVGIEERRAHRIAIDQSHKASNALAVVRADEAGLIFGIWRHNNGGSKTFRDGTRGPENHVALDGEIFIISQGMIDIPGGNEYVQTGERPFCKCDFSVILPGTPEYVKALQKFPDEVNDRNRHYLEAA